MEQCYIGMQRDIRMKARFFCAVSSPFKFLSPRAGGNRGNGGKSTGFCSSSPPNTVREKNNTSISLMYFFFLQMENYVTTKTEGRKGAGTTLLSLV